MHLSNKVVTVIGGALDLSLAICQQGAVILGKQAWFVKTNNGHSIVMP